MPLLRCTRFVGFVLNLCDRQARAADRLAARPLSISSHQEFAAARYLSSDAAYTHRSAVCTGEDLKRLLGEIYGFAFDEIARIA